MVRCLLELRGEKKDCLYKEGRKGNFTVSKQYILSHLVPGLGLKSSVRRDPIISNCEPDSEALYLATPLEPNYGTEKGKVGFYASLGLGK